MISHERIEAIRRYSEGGQQVVDLDFTKYSITQDLLAALDEREEVLSKCLDAMGDRYEESEITPVAEGLLRGGKYEVK